MTYKMIVKTQTAGRTETETFCGIEEAKVERYREVARTSAPIGATVTIRIVGEK